MPLQAVLVSQTNQHHHILQHTRYYPRLNAFRRVDQAKMDCFLAIRIHMDADRLPTLLGLNPLALLRQDSRAFCLATTSSR